MRFYLENLPPMSNLGEKEVIFAPYSLIVISPTALQVNNVIIITLLFVTGFVDVVFTLDMAVDLVIRVNTFILKYVPIH